MTESNAKGIAVDAVKRRKGKHSVQSLMQTCIQILRDETGSYIIALL